MSERWSRFAVAIEAILFAFPVTYLAISAFLSGIDLMTHQPLQIYERAQAIVYSLPILPLAAGWVLMARFVAAGSPALRASGNWLWLLSILGAMIALAAPVVGRSTRNFAGADSLSPWVLFYFRDLFLGIPAIVPLIHLMLERRLRMSSNNRWRGP